MDEGRTSRDVHACACAHARVTGEPLSFSDTPWKVSEVTPAPTTT